MIQGDNARHMGDNIGDLRGEILVHERMQEDVVLTPERRAQKKEEDVNIALYLHPLLL